MAGTIPPISRVSSMMSTDSLLARLRDTQRHLFETQRQISTGQAFSRASDIPDRVSTIMFLERRLDERAQQSDNLRFSRNVLDTADQALGDASNILLEARDIASSQVGVGSDTKTRQTEAVVIDAQLTAMIDIANRQFSDLSVFGGNNGAIPEGQVFESFLGGVRYRGSAQNLQNDVGTLRNEDFTSNGVAAFGALSGRVRSNTDLQPQPTAATRLSDIRGATDDGVTRGSLVVMVNGTDVTVDLSTADTLGDVTTRVNSAIDSVDPTAGALSIAGDGFTLSANAGATISIEESGQGGTAQSLGLVLDAGPGPASDAGPSVGTVLTLDTSLASLGAGIDFASGMQITQGEKTKTADFSGATTLEDMVNEIDALGLGLRLEINEAGTGLDMVSEVSGVSLSVGENGGSTAQDLGLRTLGTDTNLSDFRFGKGVQPLEGEADITIALHDGTSFDVDLTGTQTVQDVLDAIDAAAAGAGLTPGVDFSAGLAATGNGFVFEDMTAGGDDFSITNANTSLAGTHLGIVGNAGGGATLEGADHAQVRVENAFTHLIDLRDALTSDSTSGITLAGGGLEDDIDRIVAARAVVGVQARRIEDQQTRSEDMDIAEQSMLSTLKDTELTEAISRFTQLQTQLQASLSVGAQNMQMSLMDFLR